MKLIIDIPDKETKEKQTYYFTVHTNNGEITISSTEYFKEKHGIDFKIEKEGDTDNG